MERYKVNRIGFVNFWLYDEEDFYFYDGKLLLRGSNGSGKTVTMQSFFPLIFDGNKSPERLDPFGSRDRKIEDYLLMDGFQGQENTGYLYMEFYNKEENKYLTIGIGLRAIRNRGCEFWGFSITDNRRIGTDFLLFKERNLRIPLTKKELQTRIGQGGEFVESTKEYKKMVNRLLFGFQNVDLYTEFINLLIQIRSPKLSNSTKPSQLTNILSSVLEPLSEDDLRIMADSIEDMNKYKEKMADLQNEQKACNGLKLSYTEYNKSLLYTKGEQYLKYKKEQNDITKQINNKEEELQRLLSEIVVETNNIKELNIEQQALLDRKSKLDETDLKIISNQLEETIKQINDFEEKNTLKQNDFTQKENTLLDDKKALKVKETELYNIEKSFEDLLSELTNYEKDLFFDDAKFYLEDLKKKKFAFEQMPSYLNTMHKQIELLNKIKDMSYNIYLKEKEIEDEKNKYEKNNDDILDIEKRYSYISNTILQLANSFKETIVKISNDNNVLKLSTQNINDIFKIIDDLENDMYLKIKGIIKNRIYEINDSLKLNLSNNAIKINEYKNKIASLNEDLKNIENIFINNLGDIETRNYFEQENIGYKYFYEVIDFKNDVPTLKKKQIESFLLETGLLTSFITSENTIDNTIKSKCLRPSNKCNNNLSSYLYPLETEYKQIVMEILESISIDDDYTIKILETGKYQYAIMEGNVDSNHELKYIGLETRKSYIEKEKEKINITINKYEREIELIEEDNCKISNNINLLDSEFSNYVFPIELPEQFKLLGKIDLELEYMKEKQTSLINVIKEKNKELKLVEEELAINKKGFAGPTKYEEIKNILDDTNVYFSLLNELEKLFSQYISKEELVLHYKEKIEELTDDLDSLKLELDKISFDLINLNNKKQNIDDVLNSDKYKDVGDEYKKIIERLNFIKDEIPNKNKIIVRNETNCEHLKYDIGNLKITLQDVELLKKVTYKIFLDEYNLKYVESSELQEDKIENFVKSIKPNGTNKDIYEKFNDSASKYSQILINYAPKNITLHLVEDNEYLNYTNDESKKDTINNLLEDAKRRDLVFNYLGKSVNLLDLNSFIDNSISSYDNLISEENRRLFENLLINNIGSSIRNKIWQSEEWIEQVKKLMESMNTSSGLSFSLKWSGIAAMTEDELDTNEIVNIFKQDPDKLRPEHLINITNHFKSKIKMKEESLEESERNYLEIIKEVLDYRKWFEFKLYFKRGTNDKKELTDREFNKMSGGEKAIAMYIPLFSSVFAKLNSAYPYSPRVIALDEAFAGVDDENIKDAFRILSKLDIDYVLTSQQLWGDYETIKHLAISELHHPIGSNVVSVVKYKWDGISRSKVEDEQQYQY